VSGTATMSRVTRVSDVRVIESLLYKLYLVSAAFLSLYIIEIDLYIEH